MSLIIRCDEMATCTQEDPKNKPQPQLVKLDKAFKLAERWVNNMSKSSADEKSNVLELEGRPSRLGIGATVPKESRIMRSDNPVEKKLLAKLHVNRKKDMISSKDGDVDRDSEEEEEDSESKTKYFVKKRPQSFTAPLQGKKKHR